jgi:hypothetical protein
LKTAALHDSAGSTSRNSPRNAAASQAVRVSSSAGRTRLPSTDNGLEIRKVIVAEQTGSFLSTITQQMYGPAIDQSAQERLQRNGLRMVRVPLERLDPLLKELGGPTMDVSEWHGQALEWRPVQQRGLANVPRALAIDGRVNRYEVGGFSLMMRSWTVQMEDGMFVHLEMIPRREYPQQSNDLRRLIGKEPSPDENFYPTMGLDLQMQAGFAYILFGEPPQTPWPDAVPSSSAPTVTTNAQGGTNRTPRPRVGPAEVGEADAAAPLTLGEFLLVGDRKPVMRGLIIFLPRIAPELLAEHNAPDQQASSTAANR